MRRIKKIFETPIYFLIFGAIFLILFICIFYFFTREDNISILNFGDVMLDRGVRNIVEKRGRDPFEYIKKSDVLEKYDVVAANLEGPIVEMDRSLCQDKIYNFQFSGNTPDVLKKAGITAVNIANNHSLDCYHKGFESTKKYLRDAGIPFMGDADYEKSYFIKEIKGKKIAFVGIDAVTNTIPVSGFYPLIQKLKKENNYVVVDIHWGTEYLLSHDRDQERIGHKLIDSGVDVIFGHHPHVVEPVEIYKNRVIFYSLGNFVFDQDFGDTTVGLGAGVSFSEKKWRLELYPFNIKKFAPDFMSGNEKEKFCENYLKDIEHQNCSFEIKL